MKIISDFREFFKKEVLLYVSAIFALSSMIFVMPNREYWQYIDFRVLCLLFCLMIIVSGFRSCGLFEVMAQRVLNGCNSTRSLIVKIILMTFFSSMLITNDVALITFVPFTIFVMKRMEREKQMAFVIVLQTIAANMGSMVTQVGNPQNLYIYSFYNIEPLDFFMVTIPISIVSLLCILFITLISKSYKFEVCFDGENKFNKSSYMWIYSILFLFCLASVFGYLNYIILTIIVLICIMIFDKSLYKSVDYSLLLTFICFFIFSGNIGNIPETSRMISKFISKDVFLTTVTVSQIISNVPAAVILSHFTSDWKLLLLGSDIGGLGTPVASLASLISLKIYFNTEGAKKAYYFWIFMLINLVMLILLTVAYKLYEKF